MMPTRAVRDKSDDDAVDDAAMGARFTRARCARYVRSKDARGARQDYGAAR